MCNHGRDMHNGIKKFEEKEAPEPYEKDGSCHVSNHGVTCTCEKYEEKV